ncbi:hypothetical protein AZE42_09337 [Rhizopogon vesiculosus]|uniref:Uncharacterized protein n=1 Tax=Rhizopogon vesiculosus TaxID=180088 RepID=A0A1J8QM38_9AGAM|nr:hypothetical protein AZE42_09337 [Rhizopogon vesiculosus]
MLSHPPRVRMTSSVAFPRSSMALNQPPVRENRRNSNTPQGEVFPPITVLVLLMLLLYATNRHCMLLPVRNELAIG